MKNKVYVRVFTMKEKYVLGENGDREVCVLGWGGVCMNEVIYIDDERGDDYLHTYSIYVLRELKVR